MVQARIDSVSAGTIFSGVDNSDPWDTESAVFKLPKNHAKAVASILHHAAKDADFRPKDQGLEASSKAYGQFVSKVIGFHGFKTHKSEERLDLSGDIEQFKQQIADKYRSSSGKAGIVAYVYGNQIPDTLEEQSQQWLLTLIALRGEEDNSVTFDLSSIPVKLSKRRDDVRLDKQTTVLRQLTFRVDGEYLEDHARKLADDIKIITVDDFLEELSTPYQGDDDDLMAWLKGSNKPIRQSLYPLSQLRLRH